MLRRMFWLAGAVALIATAGGFAVGGSASAQEPDPGQTARCAINEPCTGPAPCDTETLCTDPGPCPTDVICTGPINCPTNEPCAVPGPCPADAPCGPCPTDVICTGPIDCSTQGACPEPVPPPCRLNTDCQFGDADNDGWQDFIETAWGSNPNDANSTPEHGYLPETCSDGIDNDGDGAIDMSDSGCRIDSDGDGWADLSDNCPWDTNALQADRDGDGIGDACDYDADNDGWDDETERQTGSDPNNANSTPEHSVMGTCEDGIDNDADGMTDAADAGCAPDQDYDYVPDATDNCPTMWNQHQADSDHDGTGDACEDSDSDGFFDIDEGYLGSDPRGASSTPEYSWFDGACTDGVDNDHDGTTDGADEGCQVIIEPVAMEDGTAYTPMSARDTYNGRMYKNNQNVQPIALPAAGAGPAGEGNSMALIIALASAVAAVAGSGLAFAGLRIAKRTTRR